MIRKRRTASVERHEISRPVEPETRKKRMSGAFPGFESQADRARFLSYAAVVLEGPGGAEPPSSGAHSEEPEKAWGRRAEDKRHACALLHYSQN